MRILLALTLLVSLNACSQLQTIIPDALKQKISSSEKSDNLQKNSNGLFVVHIHGDWCKTCASIDSPIHSVEPYFEAKNNVEYLIFDQTSASKIHESLAMAKGYGLANLFEHQRHTGEVIFVDKKTKKILTKVYGVVSAEKYQEITEKLLNGEAVPSILAQRKNYDLSKPEFDEAAMADLLVIDIHHDMCGGCVTTAPVFEEVAHKYRNKEEVCFLTFDLTTPKTVDDSRNLARSLGIESIYNTHKHTGEVLFVDLKSKKVLGSLITETDKDKYYELVKEYRKQIKA
jgi:thiol-disulfide isomerase/thioredoxin